MNNTYHQEVSLLISPYFTDAQIKKARTALYARTLSSPMPSTDLISQGPPCVATETPLLLRFSLLDRTSNPNRSILTHGGIPAHLTTDWTYIPSILRPKVHRLLHRLIITHHHSTWLTRNKVAHPQDAIQPIIIRRPPNPTTAPKPPSLNQKAKARKWKRDRARFMERDDMWFNKAWIRLCKLAKHSNKTIAKKRKRAAQLRT